MVQWTMKAELKFVSTDYGELFAPQLTGTTIRTGISMMQKLSVDSLDTKNLVYYVFFF